MLPAEGRVGGELDLLGHVAGGRQPERFIEARSPETLCPGAADSQLRDRRELRAYLRREVLLPGRIFIVTTGKLDLQLVQDRCAQLPESRLHVTATGGA